MPNKQPPTLPEKTATPCLEMQLMHILRESTVSDLLKSENESLRLLLVEISVEVTMEKALQAPKLFQLRHSIGERDLLKLICFILKAFADSLKVKNSLSIPEIIETANLIMEKYTHESVKDFILAFKQVKLEGRKFYHILSAATVFEILNDYFLQKAKYMENKHQSYRQAEANNQIQWLKKMPEFMQQKYLKFIPKNQANRSNLRLRLSLHKYYKQ
jgi:hypothetical protein